VVGSSVPWTGVGPLIRARRKVPPSYATTDPMATWNQYLIPQSLYDALRLLDKAPGKAQLIAGGTDLLLEIQQGRRAPADVLIDVNQIPDLNSLEIRQDFLFIGAAVPLSKIATSPLVIHHATALCEAAALIGGPQVRNTGTLGGNVAHALPAADGTIALMVMNVAVEIASSGGARRVPLASLFSGPGQSTLNSGKDILVGYYLPLINPNQATAFSRVMRPQGVALPILNMAVWLERSNNKILDLRISIGPAGPTPQRGNAAEDALRGQELTKQNVDKALDDLLVSLHYRSSPQRGSAGYRRHLSRILLSDVLQKAWRRTFVENDRDLLVEII
jgi:CO/xanthine dehydrogenase FAD-binding subunit